jgi:N-acetylglucosaminyldiphosphoundecaprenol N-acetyl-beta-D-mannosaminyltransferase
LTSGPGVQGSFVTRPILGVHLAVSNYEDVVQKSLCWARERQSRALVFCTVHMVMEAVDNPAFMSLLNRADMINADGMPLAWAMRSLGEKNAQRVCGPDTTAAVLAAAEKSGLSVGFYGGSPAALKALVAAVRAQYPRLKIAFFESPPFRALTPEEDAAVVERMASSGLQLLFVGLGCPKQEFWVMEHIGKVQAVMFAVGAAFDFIAGSKRRAPRWMQRCGLEWVFRLASEPRRLAMRYLKHNPRFVIQFLRQLFAGSV